MSATATTSAIAVNQSIIDAAIKATESAPKKANKANKANKATKATASVVPPIVSAPKAEKPVSPEVKKALELTETLKTAIATGLASNLAIGRIAESIKRDKVHEVLGYASFKAYFADKIGCSAASVMNYMGLARLANILEWTDAELCKHPTSILYRMAEYSAFIPTDERRAKLLTLFSEIEGKTVDQACKVIMRKKGILEEKRILARMNDPKWAGKGDKVSKVSKADSGNEGESGAKTEQDADPKVTTGERYVTIKFTGVSLAHLERYCASKGIDVNDKDVLSANIVNLIRNNTLES